MNYRHIYHAGHICDVVKHAIQSLVIAHLCVKEKGFAILDTHAGIGLYDLQDPRAVKTGEAEAGIKRLIEGDLASEIPDYHAVLKKMNPLWRGEGAESFRTYPGSPLISFHMLRPQDRLILCEAHPEEFETLRHAMPADPRVQIHKRDGYEALTAFLPPPEKRGFVLIDPPFESPDEFTRLAVRIRESVRRWPSGVFLIWYPVKDRPAIWRFQESLRMLELPNAFCAEFIWQEETRADFLNGSGMIVINPPWRMDEKLRVLFAFLHTALRVPQISDRVGALNAP